MASALVGRDQPARVLEAEVARTLTSHGGLVLVAGEAGIGKSALVAGAVAAARAGGALVAMGACWDREGAPDHWPWVQVTRALARSARPETWEEARREAGGELSVLLGGGATGLGGPTGDEFGLHDAVTTLLVALARDQPLVVVLEDLHWADPASLRLVEFVARHGWYERLLLVGTYRDVEVDTADHPLAAGIAALTAKATTVTLTGLDRDEVGALVATTTGRTPPAEVVDDLHRRTGGNPLFVEQTARLWLSRGTADTVPPGVRDVVAHRLDLLPAPTRYALATLALLGHRVARPVVAAALACPVDNLDAALAEAVAARLVVPVEDDVAFVHDLVREALVAGLPDDVAAARHADLVGVLSDPALDPLVRPGDRAHHAHRAGTALDLERRLALLRAAASDASDRMAPDEAAGHLRRALAITPDDRPRERTFTLVELGWVLMRLGETDQAQALFEEATRIAVALDDASLLTRAALSLRAAVWLVADEKSQLTATEMVDEAHRRLVVEAGRPSAATTSWEREQELTERAVEMCRSSGDDRALWDALSVRHDAIWTPGRADERLAVVDEMVEVARRNGADGNLVEAQHLRFLDLVEAGDPAAREAHVQVQAVARRLGSAWSRSLARWDDAQLALLEGRFDDARAALDETEAIDSRARDGRDDLSSLVVQVRWAIELQQGRDDAVDALLTRADEIHPHPELLRAVTAVERGDAERAARTVTELRGTPAEPGRWFTPLWLRLQAQVAATTGDTDLASALAAELRPVLASLAGQWVLMAQGAVDGPFDLWAGLVEAAQGDLEAAEVRLAAASVSAEGLGAEAWAVRSRAHLLDLRRRRGEDPAQLADELDAVRTAARTLGLARVVDQLGAPGRAPAADREPTATPAAAPAAPEAPRPTETGAEAVFRRAGDVWELTFAGSTVHVPDAKGIRDLHVLLGRPGMGVRAVDLLDPEAGAVGRAARSMGGDEVLDERAKAAYRTRLTQLDEEIDAALARSADGRAAELDRERAALIEELRRATGLGGRSRRLGDDAERARKAVRERIRDTIRRLDAVHPALAAHLRDAVRTGATCSYEPAEPVSWAR
ncbi:AAA family ATPase [Iamia sp. SCSIO 61187]|uniref:ATP-binding protein n=1 Tax=Iamia sp. SCSIO 61187 TaxID=2722752 RepID=UPI001C62638C|nr:AAA family ATPase [Iamia sp. SCSIO 61187]QYG95156.1 AAA family ATPase [Iamia sp. SCSIO 61187]